MNLHSKIMNLRSNATTPEGRFCARSNDYKEGHRDARHAAAELALKADALADALRLYVAAGIGHSTDIALQLDAHTAAMQALREYEA